MLPLVLPWTYVTGCKDPQGPGMGKEAMSIDRTSHNGINLGGHLLDPG